MKKKPVPNISEKDLLLYIDLLFARLESHIDEKLNVFLLDQCMAFNQEIKENNRNMFRRLSYALFDEFEESCYNDIQLDD